MGFKEMRGDKLQCHFHGCSIYDDTVQDYLVEMATHATDHDGGVGISLSRGMLQLPRVKFEELPLLRNPDLPPEFGCRRATAFQLAIYKQCVVIVVSKETGCLSLFTQSCIYTEDGITSVFGGACTGRHISATKLVHLRNPCCYS